MTLYVSDTFQNKHNSVYPHKVIINSPAELEEAAHYDHVCATYRGNHRSNDNFIESDCLVMDCDNDHSEEQAEWKGIDDVKAAFPGVDFYVVPSRNNDKEKKYTDAETGRTICRAARPRFHVYFPIDTVTDYATYRTIKEKTIERFPWFDHNAKDSARFIFGANDAHAQFIGGDAA